MKLKYCKDCEYYKTLRMMKNCCHSENLVKSLVDGDPQAVFSAEFVRAEAKRCGMDANWFKAKEGNHGI